MIKTQHCPNCEATERKLSDFQQKVSDIVKAYSSVNYDETAWENLTSLIIPQPKPKPDPIAEAWIEATGNTVGMGPLNAALEARGLEIREKGQ